MWTSGRSPRAAVRATWLLGIVAGCGLPVDDGVGYVVVDESARGAGLQIDGDDATVRPRAAIGRVVLRLGDDQASAVTVGVGDVVHVSGADAAVVRYPLGTVRTDAWAIRAGETEAHELGLDLGADVASRADGTLALVGPDVWAAVASLDRDPAGVAEIMPIPIEEAASVAVAPLPFGDRSLLDSRLPRSGAPAIVAQGDLLPDILLARDYYARGSVPLPPGTRARPASADHYSSLLASSSHHGCSRSSSHVRTNAAIALDLVADGSATACRARTVQTTSRSFGLIRPRDGAPLPSPRFFSASSRERTGYRGTWRLLDDGSIGVALVRDDTVCDPLAEGVATRTAPLELRCTGVSGRIRDLDIALPGRGLACVHVGNLLEEHRGWSGTSEPIWLGPDHGWDIAHTWGRWAIGENSITRRTSPARLDDVLDPPAL